MARTHYYNNVLLTFEFASWNMFMSGYSLVMCACGMSALGIVLTKLISKSVEKLLILFYLGLATATTGTVGLLVFGQPSLAPATDWVLAIVIGLLGMVQQYVLVWAVQVTTVNLNIFCYDQIFFQLESPARVTVVRQFQIVLAYGVQVGKIQHLK